jgi:vinculin
LVFTGKTTGEAAENRNYLASRMTDEINEIIRVLQLTTYDEDEWDADNLTCMKKAQVRGRCCCFWGAGERILLTSSPY